MIKTLQKRIKSQPYASDKKEKLNIVCTHLENPLGLSTLSGSNANRTSIAPLPRALDNSIPAFPSVPVQHLRQLI